MADVNEIPDNSEEEMRADIDIIVGEIIGPGAIPFKGRQKRKEPCACCMIDPKGANVPANRICTTKGAVGTLNEDEQLAWCSKVTIVENGRCKRAAAIQELSQSCKVKYKGDVKGFFNCFAKAFMTKPPERDIFASVGED